ncbi:unnamed protein product [Moneuplotes crassus]|uniref:MI domain-containing protein n=2 Tax=Euplotes crassus TaxID=5936 RepID=A0AAD1Y4L9_EUPCR|nr:unnamed protein product [Moneuplotes crassus]
MERKQKKAIKADYFSRRHVAIKKQVEKQKKFERERKEKQKKKQMNKNKNKNKSKDKQTFKKEIKAKSQQKKRDIKSLQKQKEAETNAKESIQVSDDEEIKSDEIIDSDSSEDVVAQKPAHKTSQKKQKKGFQMLEANTIPKESELESDKKEIQRLEKLLGIKGNPKEAKRVKRRLDAEMGLGLEFMDFLDEIENVVHQADEQEEQAEGYDRPKMKFEEESDEEEYRKAIEEDSDQSGFDEPQEEQEEQQEESEDSEDQVMEEEKEDVQVKGNRKEEVENRDLEEDKGEKSGDEGEGEGEESEEEKSGERDNEDDQVENQEPMLEETVRNEIRKNIVSCLNKLSDGNTDIIFKKIHEFLSNYIAYPETISGIYFEVFKKICIDSRVLNSAILSVNCLVITALQRLIGQSFFAPIVNELHTLFVDAHKKIHAGEGDIAFAQMQLKNIISIFSHFYLFESVTHKIIFDVIVHMMKNFKEKDLEMLLNLLHNIGGILRKDSPALCKDIMLLFDSKKIEAEISAPKTTPKDQEEEVKTSFERKINYLSQELNDIKNNKINSKFTNNHGLTWLKKNSQVKSELLKNPLDVDFKVIESAKNGVKWWLTDEEKLKQESSLKINEIEKKIDKSYLAQLEAAAKAQHYVTDIQKSVFYTLMSSEDYLDAFQNIQKLGLKKKQERDIIKVIIQCCVQEKVYNKYYALILKKLCDGDKTFQYSCKYTLWDYLKIIDDLGVRKIANLARIYGHLFSKTSIPINMLKYIDFYDEINKFQRLFLNVVMDEIFYSKTTPKGTSSGGEFKVAAKTITAVFEKIKTNTDIGEFKDGLSSYLASNYYKYRTKKKGCDEKEISLLEKKLKIAMDLLSDAK